MQIPFEWGVARNADLGRGSGMLGREVLETAVLQTRRRDQRVRASYPSSDGGQHLPHSNDLDALATIDLRRDLEDLGILSCTG